MLSHDFYDAHRYLLDEFRNQLSPRRLEEMVDAANLNKQRRVPMEVDRTLFSQRTDRGFPAVVVVYLVAQLQNSDFQSLRCELLPSDDDAWRIVDFSSDFEASFPVSEANGAVEILVASLQRSNAEALLQLLGPTVAGRVELPLLEAYQQTVLEELGEVVPDFDPQHTVHRYQGGQRFEFAEVPLTTSAGHRVLRATFRFGELLEFGIDEDGLPSFVAKLSEVDHFPLRVRLLLESWLLGDQKLFSQALAAEVRDGPTMDQLQALRGGWRLSYGEVESIECQLTECQNADQIQVRALLRFAQKSIPIQDSATMRCISFGDHRR